MSIGIKSILNRNVVLVSTSRFRDGRWSRDVVSKRRSLAETWEGLGLDLVSD